MDIQKADRRRRIEARQKEIGALLREHRKLRGLTMEHLGTLLGMRRQSYSSIENGETAISVPELEILMEALGITRDEMWPLKEPKGRVRRVELPIVPGETLLITVDMGERL
ncbi:MAG TPA: helix-turn-helix transcriptional regulator [Chloroflexia bacterium]|jgi:transcriptional regulator with XRE-family HTH domain